MPRATRAPRKPRPRRTSRRQNASEQTAAARLSEGFHGRPARKVRDIEETELQRLTLAELGRLEELMVILPGGQVRQLVFRTARPRLCSTPEGGQLYIVGGDQTLDLTQLAVPKGTAGKDHVDIGNVHKIVYRTSKAFHSFEPTDYVHEFGEEGGTLPTLGYDVLNQRMYLIGGSYQIQPEGITN